MKSCNLLAGAIFLCVLSIGSFCFGYDNQGYPYTITEGCRQTCFPDDWQFCKNNCTSYAAFVLNLYGVPFNNSYLLRNGNTWHDGDNWDNAADTAGIPKSDTPIPGDIAQWNYINGTGHVAFVEKVYYEANGFVEAIDVTEYNYNLCVFGSRKLYAGSSDYPDNFIHILAYNETVTGMHYLDCYEMDSLCPNQTKGEWWKIVQQV